MGSNLENVTVAPTLKCIGIDPALRCTGYSVVEACARKRRVIDCGVIKLSPKAPLSECLRRLSGGIRELITAHRPEVAALEGGFYSRNARTALLLGSARGVVIASMAEAELPIYEYAPRLIKQAVCGYGHASKEQVATMLSGQLRLDLSHLGNDATDALGVAICHLQAVSTSSPMLKPQPL